MRTPDFLKPNDKIAFIAPSRSVTPEEIEKAIATFEANKFEVVKGQNLYKKYYQFAGTDMERASDIQRFLNDPEIKALLCVRGGYGAVRTLQLLDFEKFEKHPKWMIGYSDITVFHSYINSGLNIESLHAPMAFNFGKEDVDQESLQGTIDFLKGKMKTYHFDSHPLNKKGTAEGELIGGNLSVIYSLRKTPADINTADRILFLEDLDEYLYHIDRMIMNLKYGNKLSGLKGVIVGDMTEMKDNAIPFGKSAYEIIADAFAELNIPVCFGFPAGHGKRNWPLILGHRVTLKVGKECSLKFNK